MERYRLEDIDVDAFARQWLQVLDSDEASAKGLLNEAHDKDFLGPAFMMANIGPQAVKADASGDELVLFAVLAAFQNAQFPGRQEGDWSGPVDHLAAAFAYANEIGRSGVARNLLAGVVRRSRREPGGFFDQLTAASLGNNPARIAAHEQEMAQIWSREIRAAGLLDPALSLETLLLNPMSSTDG